MTRPTLAIDPGLQGTGVAYFDRDGELRWVKVINPTKGDWLVRASHMATAVRMLLMDDTGLEWHSTQVVCELMEMHGSARARMMWAGGDLQRTLILTGMFCARLRPCPIDLIPPSKWKGQMPKDVVQRRIEKKLGKAYCRRLEIKTHAWDAVGIGLFSLGRF